jgi:hypothetical protein
VVDGDDGRQISTTDSWIRREMRWGKVAGNYIQRAIGEADISFRPQVLRQVSRYCKYVCDNFLPGFKYHSCFLHWGD